ncbi:pyridoxamine 5'-phosphate oxidase family protein [Xanthobacter sp. KR7-225]|uniref:pyridoxamine 5'-phosphate oxidase family protein n=1 Tax=Xanthobacter sp. KR7-225 TaxID=3156613 RepID=UPI0032B38521
MTARFLDTVFTPAVRAAQEANGSRHAFSHRQGAEGPDRLGEPEAAFIAARDSFYLASVTETGWPYMQHRGGPPGFVKIIDPATIGFADFRGNRQYVSLGNASADDRVALFFMDYARCARLKLLGRMRAVEAGAEPDVVARVTDPGYKARVERVFVISVEAFDWNCPQHITPRFTAADLAPSVHAMRARIAELEAALAQRGAPAPGDDAPSSGPAR